MKKPWLLGYTRVLSLLLCSMLANSCLAAGSADRLVRLATLEWPPYNSAALPEGGMNTALVRKVFKQAGYQLEVVTLPWNRAVDLGLHGQGFDGYFPEYTSPTVRRQCELSASIGNSPIVLAKHKSAQYVLRSVADLMRYRIGVVSGYNNTEAFDANVARGGQKVDLANTDEQNLVKLVYKRVDMVIIDRNVMDWLLFNTVKLKPYRNQLDAVHPSLDDQALFICFKRSPRGVMLARAFNQALPAIEADTSYARYMQSLTGRSRLKPRNR